MILAGTVPPARQAVFRRLRDADGETLDHGLVLFFPGPGSFTGEDCAEFHVHGGQAVVASVLSALGALPSCRAAEAGEFTRRAFVMGKLDLTEAEALADLLQAETEAQRRFALANGSGRNAVLYAGWRERLLHARATIEAFLDFAEEEDVGALDKEAFAQGIAPLAEEIRQHRGAYRQAEIIRSGFQVVILGAPNAGKSSLLNALAARDVAIVTDEPGTTRDLVHVDLDLDGLKVIVTDTAGIRDDAGRVEAIGIERAREAAAAADLIIALEDITQRRPVMVPQDRPVLRVGNKCDLLPPGVPVGSDSPDLLISARSGTGIDGLIKRLATFARAQLSPAQPMPFRERHVAILERCARHVENALDGEAPMELRAEELRLAADELARITGAIETEEMLGAIFSTFCIGK